MDNGERQSFHDLRGHLSTIAMSVAVLVTETELTEAARKAVKRIAVGLENAERRVAELERSV